MPKLLQILAVNNIGSTGTIAENLSIAVQAEGWESWVAYGQATKESTSKLIKIGNKWDIWTHGVESLFFDRHGKGSRRATRKLIEQIKLLKPDIIQLHNVHGYYINYEMLFDFFKSIETPIFWTLHDCWLVTGHCAWFDYVGCEKWKTGCHQCPQLRTYPYSSGFIDRSKQNWFDKKAAFSGLDNLHLIPVSHWLQGLIKQSFLKDTAVTCIHNGIDTSLFCPDSTAEARVKIKYNIESNHSIVLGVASPWLPRKGWKDFLELGKNLEKSTKLIMVGLSSKQLKEIPENVIGIQQTDSKKDMVDLYSAADLFLNLTYEDNFPTTNLESIACGTPVLTYKTGGSPEALDQNTGWVFDTGSFEEVFHFLLVNRLKEEKQKRTENCRKRALSLFDYKTQAHEYVRLYFNHLS